MYVCMYVCMYVIFSLLSSYFEPVQTRSNWLELPQHSIKQFSGRPKCFCREDCRIKDCEYDHV